MKRAVALFGAGASIDYKAPSTASLTSAIEQEVMSESYMQQHAFETIKSGLADYLDSVNFEQIYHCAHELIFTYSPTSGAFDEFKPVLQPFVSNKTDLTEQALRGLCDKIVKVVVAEVSCVDFWPNGFEEDTFLQASARTRAAIAPSAIPLIAVATVHARDRDHLLHRAMSRSHTVPCP